MGRMIQIFRKELKDILRDRRTLLMMVVLPLVLVPALIGIVALVERSQVEKAAAKRLKIAFAGREFAPELYDLFQQDQRFAVSTSVPGDSISGLVAQEELDGGVAVDSGFGAVIRADRQARVRIFYKSSDAYGTARSRLRETIEQYDQKIREERIRRLQLDRDLFDPIAIDQVDVASMQEVIGKLAGGYLPYLFIIFGFMGAMYPGIDLGAGEKERGTLETLLSSPASRLEIVLGKFLVVMLSAIITALIAMFGLYLAVQQLPDVPVEIIEVVMEMLGPRMILMVLSLIIPIAAFFAALILGLSIYARSFKEAQSIIAPTNIIVIIPVVIGLLPGMELDAGTALIPILNVSLATKDMLAGAIKPLYLLEVYLSLFTLAGLSLWGCVRWFNREETLFRS